MNILIWKGIGYICEDVLEVLGNVNWGGLCEGILGVVFLEFLGDVMESMNLLGREGVSVVRFLKGGDF